jgi:pyruvate formate lyase activating enzyme
MNISGIQKLTLLDFPGKTAATVFSPGCNLRCPFCQNSGLVLGEEQPDGKRVFPVLDESELWDLLDKRAGVLDGVCLTGGEPLLQPDIAECCERIHRAGFQVKLDTNGTLPGRLGQLLDAGLVDYVAMDVKNTPDRYAETVGIPSFDVSKIERSIDLLGASDVPHEFRTTVVAELHTADDLRKMATWLAEAPAWNLQQFRDGDAILAGSGVLHPWPVHELKELLPDLQKRCPRVALRGVE